MKIFNRDRDFDKKVGSVLINNKSQESTEDTMLKKCI